MWTQGRGRGPITGLMVACAMFGQVAATVAEAQSPRRDLSAYVVFGLRNANVKDLDVLGPCNTGVNCAKPSTNSDCGVVSHEDSFYADGSQIVGDQTKFSKSGANVFQVFTNDLQGKDTTIRDALVDPVTLPIIPDLDGDGQPSCRTAGQQCVADPGDLAKACGFPNPFPACNSNNPVVVAGGDCMIGGDSQPGNAICDLPAGVYGSLNVQNGSAISFDGGTYVFCDVVIGKNTTATSKAPAKLLVHGDFNVNNGSSFGQNCGDFDVLAKGEGGFGFGRNSGIVGFFCGPERTLGLGDNNDLTGRFFADTVRADAGNRARCCGGLCACVDSVSPTKAKVNDVVTMKGECSVANVTGVKICGINAPILSQTNTELKVRVPAGAAGACPVEVRSAVGTFILDLPLNVTP
jgi:hypothetical protein